ncbi:hypothetical protein Q5752_002050 [Cryptotrichosporon argae]
MLGETDFLGKIMERLEWPMVLLLRPLYAQFLHDAATALRIEIHHGMPIASMAQDSDEVVATFKDATTRRADLLVGADGLHSAVRASLFGHEAAKYTGYVQVSGHAPTPSFLQGHPATTTQYFGEGGHFMVVPISSNEVVWVWTTTQEAEHREDWRALGLDDMHALLAALTSAQWDNKPAKVVAIATSAVKYPLFEREISEVWHKGRIALIGDAAHPTSPILGQGANKAMEDCYHLVCLLCRSDALMAESIDVAFCEYEALHLPVTRQSTAMAKPEGGRRVVHGREAAEARDEALASGRGVSPDRIKLMGELLQGPFVGESVI